MNIRRLRPAGVTRERVLIWSQAARFMNKLGLAELDNAVARAIYRG